MVNIIKFISVIFFLTFSIVINAQFIGNSPFKNYIKDDYNASEQNWGFVKDSKGVLYVANAKALLTYDGVNWDRINFPESVGPKSIAIDYNDVIYYGTPNSFGFIAVDSLGDLYPVEMNEFLSNDTTQMIDVWRIYVLNNKIYFQTYNEIIIFSPYNNSDSTFCDLNQIRENFKILEAPETFYLSQKIKNKILVTDSKEGLFEIKDDFLTKSIHSELFIDKIIYGVEKYDQDNYIMILEGEILLFNPNKKELPFENFSIENTEFLENNFLYGLEKLPNERFVIYSVAKGAIIIDNQGKTLDILNKENNINDNTILSAYFDGNLLWLALNSGISKVETEAPIRFWDNKSGFEGQLNFATITRNKFLVGTDTHLFTSDESYNSFNKFSIADEISSQTFSYLEFYDKINKKNRIFIAQVNNFLEYKEDEIISYKNAGGGVFLKSKFNDSIFYVGANNLYICKIQKDNDEILFREISYITGTISQLEEDSEGNLWVGTRFNWAYKINNCNFFTDSLIVTSINQANGLTEAKEVKIIKINEQIHAINDYKLYAFNEEKNKFELSDFYNISDFTNNLFDIYFDKNSDVWIQNAIQLKQKNGKTYVNDSLLNNMLTGQVIEHFEHYKDNKYILCTSKKIYLYTQPEIIDSNKFFTLIRRVKINNDSLIFSGYFPTNSGKSKYQQTSDFIKSLSYSENSLTFNYSAPFFESEEKTMYSYKLNGYENQWSQWSEKTEKAYTNLDEGKYVFQVKAKNLYGEISEIGEYHFRIKPPWYRTIYAYIFYILMLIAVIYISIKLSVRRIVKQKEKLEQTVRERTAEIQQQKEEISAQAENLEIANHELEQQKEEISAQAEELALTNFELEKLSIVASRTDNVVLIFNRNFKLEWVNQAFYRIYGINEENFELQNINLIENSIITDIKKYIDESISKKSSITYEAVIENENKKDIWLQSTLTPIFEEHKLKKIIVIESDITKIKNAQFEISEKNKVITDSISYAKTIQQAILPAKDNICQNLDNFLLFKPKDIVSGDFYWAAKADNSLFLVAADCTGHGVPGAFMSILGSRVLDEIVLMEKKYSPAEILKKLDETIIETLDKKNTDNTDGMDLIMCKLQKNDSDVEVEFCGAKRPLIYYDSENKKIELLKGSRKTIGGRKSLYNKADFSNQKITLAKDSILYLTSDGFVDQHNNFRKKIGTKQFLNVLDEIVNLSLTEQHEILDEFVTKWQQEQYQTDDITVWGVKL